jgi:hypothetical protein
MLPDTADVRLFQRTHTDHRGRPLQVDGVRGPVTRWAEDLAAQAPVRRAIIRWALSQVGRAETPPGSNRSASIDAWLKRCGVDVGNPWCAAFVSQALSEAGPVVAIAGAVNLGSKFAAVETPLPGDLMWFRTNDRGNGHIGIVTGVSPDVVMTVEGNVDSRVDVWLRDRHAVHFSRPCLDLTGADRCPGIIASVPHRAVTEAGTR